MADFRDIMTDSRDMRDYDNDWLRPTRGQKSAARDVADRVIRALEDDYSGTTGNFHGRAVLTGSRAREVALDTPFTSDIDVLFLIQRDARGVLIRSFVEFENIRYIAFNSVKRFLARELPEVFYEAEVVGFVVGFVIKLEVKRRRDRRILWKVEVVFGFDSQYINDRDWDEIARELSAMPRSKALLQTNSFAEMRNIFLNGEYDCDPDLRILVRFLKAWYQILTKDDNPNEIIHSFVFEMLVLLLFSNDHIPADFSLRRALATCLTAIANPRRVPSLVFRDDGFDRPLSPRCDMRNQVGLVLIDPFLTINNVAERKRRDPEAWQKLEYGAQRTVDFLRSNGVATYAFGRI